MGKGRMPLLKFQPFKSKQSKFLQPNLNNFRENIWYSNPSLFLDAEELPNKQDTYISKNKSIDISE